MSEYATSVGGDATPDTWDPDVWEAEGQAILEQRYQADAEQRTLELAEVVVGIGDSAVKLALLQWIAKHHRGQLEERLCTGDSMTADWYMAQRAIWEAEGEARVQEWRRQPIVAAQIVRAGNQKIGYHPTPRLLFKEDNRLVVAEFHGHYEGKVTPFRLAAQAEQDSTVLIELPQSPEPFEPSYADFGDHSMREQSDYMRWRQQVGQLVVVGASVEAMLNTEDETRSGADGALILDRPGASAVDSFALLPHWSSSRWRQPTPPVAFHGLDYAFNSEAGRRSLIEPDSRQLEALLGLITHAQPLTGQHSNG